MFERTLALNASYFDATKLKYQGRKLVLPCYVGWPELQLNEEQVLANAIAMMDGKPLPHAPSGLIIVEFDPYA